VHNVIFHWYAVVLLNCKWLCFACQSIKETFTLSRPYIAESFVNQLMSTHSEDATTISFRLDHLTACVNQLASDIMIREKLVFEKYVSILHVLLVIVCLIVFLKRC